MEMIHILRMDLLSLFVGLHCLKAFHQHGNPDHITSGTHLGRRWTMGSWPKDCIDHEDTAPFRISWHGGGEGMKLRRLNSGAYLQVKLRVRHCSPVCGMYSRSISNLRGRNDPDHYKTMIHWEIHAPFSCNFRYWPLPSEDIQRAPLNVQLWVPRGHFGCHVLRD